MLSYDGKVKKVIPGEEENDKGTMNFGTVGSGTENEAIFALENHNPINVELHGWGVNMPGAVLELMGCQSGPTQLFNKGIRNISVCSQMGNVRDKIVSRIPHIRQSYSREFPMNFSKALNQATWRCLKLKLKPLPSKKTQLWERYL